MVQGAILKTYKKSNGIHMFHPQSQKFAPFKGDFKKRGAVQSHQGAIGIAKHTPQKSTTAPVGVFKIAPHKSAVFVFPRNPILVGKVFVVEGLFKKEGELFHLRGFLDMPQTQALRKGFC
jgi:hypothetical protein